MDPDALIGWLDAHTNVEAGGRLRSPSLDRIRPLVELLGSPQADFPVIHVTGTNGKTTVTRLAAHLLTATGLSVGCYTSPHLQQINERMAWAGHPIGDDALAEVLDAVRAVEASLEDRPSYFEILTAAAYRWFADGAVDVAVVEVGLGGAWDATNVADGTVAVVTNVSLDHTEYLGSTRASIAAEKAGIVKPGATLVLGEADADLAGLFIARGPAETMRRATGTFSMASPRASFAVVSNQPAHGGRLLHLRTPQGDYPDLYLPTYGAFQGDNAAIALAAVEAFLGQPVAPDVVQDGFATFRTPGRLEVVGRQPLVVIDGAHNVAGAQAMRATLDEEFAVGPRTLVVGLLREKEPHAMLEALGVREAEWVVACRPASPRALDPRELAAAALELGMDAGNVNVFDRVPQALARAMAVTPPDGQVIVAGSLYLAGEARSLLVR